jgi:hypothetical protein
MEEWKFTMICDALKSPEGRTMLLMAAEQANDYEMATILSDMNSFNYEESLVQLRRHHFGRTVRMIGMCRGKLVKFV